MYNLRVAASVEAGPAVGGSSLEADSNSEIKISDVHLCNIQGTRFSPLELPALAPVPDAVPPSSAPAGDVP